MKDTFLVEFAPETWNWQSTFAHFAGVSGQFDREAIKGVQACCDHLSKYDILARLADRLVGDLHLDREELREKGFVASSRSKEYAALVEVLVSELYATLDSVRRVIFSVYRSVSGVQNRSTSLLFKRADPNTYGPSFPPEIANGLRCAQQQWFPVLHELRTELTHGQTGTCHLDEKTGLIRYIHGGLGSERKAHGVDDIVSQVAQWRSAVDDLNEKVFKHLYGLLEQKPMFLICGWFKGRLYQRNAVPASELGFGDGWCQSFAWFEREDGLQCPMRMKCAAYERGRRVAESSGNEGAPVEREGIP